jgi:sugar phosphate isomerase/epimerase
MLDMVLSLDLAPEIAIKGSELDAIDKDLLKRVRETLAATAIRPTVHAPFFDLNPGALDPMIRQVTFQRFCQTLHLAEQLNAHLMVIHPGVDKWRYPNLEKTWIALAMEFFVPLVEMAAACNCRLALENIYEESPETLVHLVNGLDSSWFGHCFDVGHWHLFGKTPMASWLEAISPRLLHLHLHDNSGQADDHLPVGEGTIDFTPLQTILHRLSTRPSITLEAHSCEDLMRSLKQAKRLVLY